MGKIVKYCNSCDEGFAAKFAFCPDCGKALEAFEMNPLEQANASVQEAVAAPVAAETIDLLEIPNETVQEAAPATKSDPVEEPIIEVTPPTPEVAPVIKATTVPVAKKTVKEPVAKAAKASATSADVFVQTKPVDVDGKRNSLEAEHDAYASDGNFYVTVIEEKNVKQRNTLMLGSLFFVIFSLMTGVVYSIFAKDLEVGAINEDSFIASLIDEVPMEVEEEEQQKKDKDAGGGGGGGREEEETTKGDLANQTAKPERPPQAIPRLTNPEVVLPTASTQGNRTFEQKYDRYGDPNGRFTNWNNGTGSGGGQGTGTGSGQGSGRGTGTGSGDGSGSGSGLGNGNGNGTGDGDGGPPPPPKRPSVTQNLAITSKPRPGYTDAARTANIQGTVILRVTFLGSGQVGSISAVKGLPNGLTEQAIAAARRISFQPKLVDGVPQSVTKQIEYTFSIY